MSLSYLVRYNVAVDIQRRVDGGMAHELSLNGNWGPNGVQPRAVAVAQRVRSKLSDTSIGSRMLEDPPDPRIRPGQAAELQRTRKDPIAVGRELRLVPLRVQDIKYCGVNRHGASAVLGFAASDHSRSRLVADLESESSTRRPVPSSRYHADVRHDPSSKARE